MSPITGMSPRSGILTGWKPVTVFTVPIVVLNNKLESPSPNMYRPMPLIPCSALRVTLMNDISKPINNPTTIAASNPNQMLFVFNTT